MIEEVPLWQLPPSHLLEVHESAHLFLKSQIISPFRSDPKSFFLNKNHHSH